jgi:hypothetical protein
VRRAGWAGSQELRHASDEYNLISIPHTNEQAAVSTITRPQAGRPGCDSR